MSSDPNLYPNPKFTRGEKCIFTHLIITFVAIIIIILIYFGHVAIVKHLGDDIYRISRRSHRSEELMKEEVVPGEASAEPAGYECVGAAYVLPEDSKKPRAACSVTLLAARWSLATAHCVSVRALPELAHLLPHWTVRYQEHSTGVRRGAVHPLYNDDDLASNVGLFEHEVDISKTVPTCIIPTQNMYSSLRNEEKNYNIVGWQGGGRSLRRVKPMPLNLCSQFVTPIVETMRGDELCFSDDEEFSQNKPLPGAVLFVNSHLIGIFSWGDSQDKSFPFVIVDIEPFKHWLETTMSLG